MVYVVKNFIKGELLADHDGHSCIISWMLNFAAGGCHQHAKGTRMYCQLIKQLESFPDCKEIFENFTAYDNHMHCSLFLPMIGLAPTVTSVLSRD